MDLNLERIPSEEPLYSFHAFLFPFEWKYRNDPKRLLEDQTDLSRMGELMDRSRSLWERRASWAKPQTLAQYNEVVYFYDFVRPVMYDTGKDDSILRHYYYKLPGGEGENEYLIELNGGKTYRLEIDDINISFFNTGVGYLAFSLFNKRQDQSAPQDILHINAYGRRIYPPFFGTDSSQIGKQAFFEDDNWLRGLEGPRGAKQLARSIRLETNGRVWAIEDFSRWLADRDLEREPDLVRLLLPREMQDQVQLTPVLDDRMFTVCWYGNQEVVDWIKGDKPEEIYKTHGWWYQYVFVDNDGPTCPNLEMRRRLLEAATDPRWINDGTFYGVSRYSFHTLTGNFARHWFGRIICSHTQTMYYKIALLALVQRACLMRFSQEVAAISQLPKTDRHIAARVSSLYKQYLRFVNKIYFREVTAQEQGIELYDTLQEQMRLEKHVKDLELEIQELHQYVSMLETEQRNDKLDILTYIGAFFVVPSFIGTYFGIADYNFNDHWLEISVFSILSAFFALGVIRSGGKYRWIWVGLLVLLMAFVLFYFPNLNVLKE